MVREVGAIAANGNCKSGPSYTSALPSDVLAIIEPVSLPVNQIGRARVGTWRLRFAMRWRARVVDPLTGWTGGGDLLTQIELHFPDLEAASRHCRREGVPFDLQGSPDLRRWVRACLTGEVPPRLCCWPTGLHAQLCSEYLLAMARWDDHAMRSSAVGSAEQISNCQHQRGRTIAGNRANAASAPSLSHGTIQT
ncbi:NADH dehydrogenase ubiquinone Fe-S protein 4 [Sphingobium sp. TB-6]|uniref:NADH dehydrogenase ubiquinone Fe-S protein 4 n=1 Tax=Sphingobium sp. TB-6 TaxID=2728850 RepID=UPI00146D768C|nr:NADH dehydrogenase ubiquinone Fe-S protein 4 [Sphingobium sp. TB-6]